MAKQVTVLKAAKSVDFVKALRTAADLGLSEAVGLAEFISTNAPCVVVAGIDALGSIAVSQVAPSWGSLRRYRPVSANGPLTRQIHGIKSEAVWPHV